MNRINPLYIVLLLTVLFIVVVIKKHTLQKELIQEQHHLLQVRNITKEIATLRKYWYDKKLQKKRINALLHSPLIARYIKSKEKKGNRYIIELAHIEARSADTITKLLLNAFIKIKSFTITKENKNTIAMKMEIQL